MSFHVQQSTKFFAPSNSLIGKNLLQLSAAVLLFFYGLSIATLRDVHNITMSQEAANERNSLNQEQFGGEGMSAQDPERTDLLMADVPAEVERLTGTRPHHNTIRRWRREGVAGVRLRTIRLGYRYLTSRRWIAEFIEASSQESDQESSEQSQQTRLTPSAARANAAAKAELKRMGILS